MYHIGNGLDYTEETARKARKIIRWIVTPPDPWLPTLERKTSSKVQKAYLERDANLVKTAAAGGVRVPS